MTALLSVKLTVDFALELNAAALDGEGNFNHTLLEPCDITLAYAPVAGHIQDRLQHNHVTNTSHDRYYSITITRTVITSDIVTSVIMLS